MGLCRPRHAPWAAVVPDGRSEQSPAGRRLVLGRTCQRYTGRLVDGTGRHARHRRRRGVRPSTIFVTLPAAAVCPVRRTIPPQLCSLKREVLGLLRAGHLPAFESWIVRTIEVAAADLKADHRAASIAVVPFRHATTRAVTTRFDSCWRWARRSSIGPEKTRVFRGEPRGNRPRWRARRAEPRG